MMTLTARAVASTAPAAGYIGGKRNLARTIVPIIDSAESDGYAEPCVGMGGVFLRRRRRLSCEVINDVSRDVSTFFRVLQRHYDYFMNEMRFAISGRDEFERLSAMPADMLTDIERAVRFLYLQRLAFGGKVEGRNFGVDRSQGARFNVTKLRDQLERIHERLAGVVIERLDYADFIRRYDRDGMLFYIDPPYWGCETDYGEDVFSRDDFACMAEQLAGIRGKFLLSINDTPGVRAAFDDFHQVAVSTTYTISRTALGANKAGELLVSNFAFAPPTAANS